MKKETVVGRKLFFSNQQSAFRSWGLGVGSLGLGVKLFVLVLALTFHCSLFTVHCFSQVGVGINTAGNAAHASSILDVSSTTKGVLIPRMTTTERDNIAVSCSCTPAEGLLIYNTTTKCFEAYVNGVWNTVSCPAACSPTSPTAGTHVPSATGIVWNWNTVSGATGYKWSTTNAYGSATDMGTGVTKTETGLTCGTSYTRYVWAYNACGQSTVVSLTQLTSACFTCGTDLTDSRDSKTYHTVLIGTQCWMKENMNAGTRIDGITPQTNNSILEKYCYDNSESNCTIYGGLYQWDEMMQYSTGQGICPSGWHVPTETEWSTLGTYIGVEPAKHLCEAGYTHWSFYSGTAFTNSSDFTALPGGCWSGASFFNITNEGWWGIATMYDATTPYGRSMQFDSYNLYPRNNNSKSLGRSVRCLN